MTKSRRIPKLALHELFVALSYWGSAVRIFLFAFVLLIALGLILVNGGSMVSYVSRYIYLVLAMAVLDAGYVTIARAVPYRERIDRSILLAAYSAIGLLAILPHVAVMPQVIIAINQWLLLPVLFLLSIRLLIGMLHNK